MTAKNNYFALAFIAANTVSKKILVEIVIRLVDLLITAYVITSFSNGNLNTF